MELIEITLPDAEIYTRAATALKLSPVSRALLMESPNNSSSIPTVSLLKTTSVRIFGPPTEDQSEMILEVADQPVERGEAGPIDVVEDEACAPKGKPPRSKHGADVSGVRASVKKPNIPNSGPRRVGGNSAKSETSGQGVGE